jgi:TPP-dependent pyruvate/acetoin dehydrogenase alpha subunit
MAARKKKSKDADHSLDTEQLVDFQRRMLEIRHFEDECGRLFAKGVVRGTTHLCQGQEATVVGACRAVDDSDTMTCTYRGHGAVLAKGAPLNESFGEILGKEKGLCRGKGGSMHLTDMRVGALGSFAIVGAHLPISVGAALASHMKGDDRVSLCFFGDGSTNIGAFHESLNMASIWKLPVVFICENNLYGEYSPLASTTPIERLADRADSYGMPGIRIDGNNVEEVFAETTKAVERARAGGGPTLIESMTYRQKGHSRSDPATYRPEGELEEWLKRDPIKLGAAALESRGMDSEQLERLDSEASERVKAALDEAMSWDAPNLETRFENVWA